MHIFKCSYCYFECWTLFKEMFAHYDTWHQDKKVFLCETCGKLFTKKCHFNVHMKWHDKKNNEDKKGMLLNEVMEEMQDFNRKKEMCRKTKEEESQLKCSHCDYEISRKSDLNRDVESKHNKSNFECGICNKSFNRKDNLKMHMKTHEEKTIQNGGGGEKQKEDNEAGLLNKNNSVGETSLGDESDSDVMEPIYEDVWMYNGMVFKRIYKRIGHKDILTCLRDYNKKYFKDLIENFQKKMRRCKFYIVVECNLKVRNHDGLLIPTTWLCKVNEDFRHITHYDDLMEGVINSVNRRFEEYDFYGKGKILTNIENITIKLACI